MPEVSVVRIDAKLVAEAESVGLDVARETELHLRSLVERRHRKVVWRRENREAIQAWNAWINENGIPFEEIRAW